MKNVIGPPQRAALTGLNRRPPFRVDLKNSDWYPRTVRIPLISFVGIPSVLLVLEPKSQKDVWWRFPGGTIDPNEEPDHAILREFEEETDFPFPDQCFLYDSRAVFADGLREKGIFCCVAIAENPVSVFGKTFSHGSEVLETRWFPLALLLSETSLPRLGQDASPKEEWAELDAQNVRMLGYTLHANIGRILSQLKEEKTDILYAFLKEAEKKL